MTSTMNWTAVVPIKAWHSAKSRLVMPSDVREELAKALALDLLDVLSSHGDVADVVVVTADGQVADEARSRGVTVLAEAGSSLNDAIRQALTWVAEVRADGPTVVVPADLAYLSAEVLTSALADLAIAGPSHVPDLSGEGTTLLAAPQASAIEPHYGVGSSAAHAAAGFRRVDAVDPRARADIDRLDDLTPAWTPGPRVSALLAQGQTRSA
jgi:2-phospho-L-lactate guanylyltransferase